MFRLMVLWLWLLPLAVEAEDFSPVIRVNLTARPIHQTSLKISGSYSVRPIGSDRVLRRARGNPAVAVEVTANGFRVDGQHLMAGRLEIVPAESPGIWFAGHRYRGTLRLHRLPGGAFQVINAVPLEEYLASVVDSEMPLTFTVPARRAQAIVARSYALAQMNRRHPVFDLYATPRSQNYLGYQYESDGRQFAGESTSSRTIVRETAGLVCLHDRRLVCAYYSAVCGGETRDGLPLFPDAAPVMRAVPCEWCRPAELYRWDRSVPVTELESRLRTHLRVSGRSTEFGSLRAIQMRDANQRVVFSDGKNEVRLTPAELKASILPAGLPSAQFTLQKQGGQVRINGRGHGHQVGLCQWGAKGMGEAGKTTEEILQQYYPGVEIVRLTR